MRLYLATGGEQSSANEVSAFADALERVPDAIVMHYEAHADLPHDAIYRSLEMPLLQALLALPPDPGERPPAPSG